MTSVLLANDPDRLSVILPAIDTDRFRETVADFGDPALAMDRFDCVVPFTLDDYLHLRRRPDRHRVNCLMPPSALVEILDDKYRCNRLLTALGFGGNIPAMDAQVTAWPIIYKKKQDAAGLHSFLCFYEDELRIIAASTRPDEYFKQQYVAGDVEYASHMLTIGGRVIYHSTVKYTFGAKYYVKGERCPAPPPEFCDCPCYGQLSAIVDRLAYTGTCCFNYKITADGLKLFEINPRFGHSLGFDINRYLTAYLDALSGAKRDTRSPVSRVA
jgi:hypothetical protein